MKAFHVACILGVVGICVMLRLKKTRVVSRIDIPSPVAVHTNHFHLRDLTVYNADKDLIGLLHRDGSYTLKGGAKEEDVLRVIILELWEGME